MGNPSALSIGPGRLLLNPSLAGTEPVDNSAAWPAGWVDLGFTDDGSEIGIETTFSDVNVAEVLDPVAILATARNLTLTFALAEITATNLKRVFNGGSITSGTGVVFFDPPQLGQEQYVMLGWESTDVQERWIFRKVIQTGKVAIPRKKAPDKAVLPVEFRAVLPTTGLQPYRAIMTSPARA